jgi:hypothetical protein
MTLTPTQTDARDKMARLAGMSREQVDAFHRHQDEINELRSVNAELLAALELALDDLADRNHSRGYQAALAAIAKARAQ